MSADKPWDRPWSMDEIIANSDKWNLAGDVALLNTLEAFAENLLRKTNEINNNLQGLTNNLDETSLQLNIAQNEFQNLRNSQFIESRVYEDDESLPQIEEKPRVEDKNDDHSEDIRLAAVKGLEVLDEYFERVEVSVSDSDDDDIDLPNYVLRPKDLYIDRPLPYVIGSAEWHQTQHVGLEDSSSDSETEKVSDKFSESDSESDLPIIRDRSQIKGTSDTSSELDFSQKNGAKAREFFASSDSENSAQGPVSGQNFAEQLAAKLGHVITQGYEEPEVNRRPIQSQKPTYGDVFFDEPPPLDEPKGMFSGGGGLFDDDDDIPYSTPKEAAETPKTKTVLFDDSDDIFPKQKINTQKPPLFDEEPPALEEKKKPVGGVSILGGGNLFDRKLLRRPSSDDDQDKEEKKVDLFSDDLFKSSPEKVSVVSTKPAKKINLFDSDEDEDREGLFDEKPQIVDKVEPQTISKEEKPEKKVSLFEDEKTQDNEEKVVKKISLFDDDDDLFKDDLFSSNSSKKFTSGLFEDIPGDDLFSTTFEEKPKSRNLFDDLQPIANKNSINNDTKHNSTESVNKVAYTPGASSDKPNLFSSSPKETFLSEENNDSTQRPPIPKPRLSLFDSPPPEPDDLFGAAETPDTMSGLFAPDPAHLFDQSPPKASATPTPTPVPNMRLFDPSPPPDDDWDAKSDNLSENGDFDEVKAQKTDLFCEEPPSLDFRVETMKNKPGKLKHNLNINVGALMPGYVPPKRVDGAATSREVAPSDDSVGTPTDEASRDSVTSFDQTDRVEVLQSVTKDRAKVPLRRRPSTRKGRKEALRRSLSDFKLEQDNNEDSENIPSSPEKPPTDLPEAGPALFEQEKTSLFDDFSKSTEDADEVKITETFGSSLFDEPLKSDIFESETPTNPTTENPQKIEKEESLFESPKSVEAKKSQKSILFDDDDEDDLFSTKKPVQPTKPKKSLFDDDDDDDIFKSFSTANVKKTDTKMATEKKIPKVSSVKKLENTKPDDDPLSALLK